MSKTSLKELINIAEGYLTEKCFDGEYTEYDLITDEIDFESITSIRQLVTLLSAEIRRVHECERKNAYISLANFIADMDGAK